MKRLRWPRPPLILGFVLGGLVERYMFISTERYGADWLWIWRDFGDGNVVFAPYVPIIFAGHPLRCSGAYNPGLRARAKTTQAASRIWVSEGCAKSRFLLRDYFVCVVCGRIRYRVRVEFGARLIPQVVSVAAMIFIGWLILSALFVAPGEAAPVDEEGVPGRGEGGAPAQSDVHFDISADYGDLPGAEVTKRVITYFAWLLFFFGASAVIGLLPAMFVFLVGYMRFEGKEGWGTTLAVATSIWLLSYFLFHKLLVIPWPQAVVGDLLPASAVRPMGKHVLGARYAQTKKHPGASAPGCCRIGVCPTYLKPNTFFSLAIVAGRLA